MNWTDVHKATLDCMGEAVYVIDRDMRIVYSNHAAEELTGYSYDESIGRRCQDIFCERSIRCEELCPLKHTLDSLNPILRRDATTKTKDGNIKQTQISFAPLYDDNNCTGAVVVVHDISELKLLEEQNKQLIKELRERHRSLRRAEEVAHMGHWEFLMNRGIVHASEEAKAIYGVKGSEWQISEIQKIPLRQYRHMLDKALTDLIEHGQSYDVEFKIQRADGRVVDIHSLAEYDTEKKLVFGIIQDITDRKKSEKALRVAEKAFRDLLESVQLLAVLLDCDGNIIFCNDYLADITGWSKEELLGSNWFEKLIPPEGRGKIREVFTSVFRGDDKYLHYENVIMTRNGRELLVSWNNTLLHDLEDAIAGTASIGIDVTRQKILEAQLIQAQKMEAVGQLAGGIAHDFNNILSAIVGYGHLLETKLADNNPLRDDVEQILDSAAKATELTKRLMTFSRHQVINAQPTNINTVVRNVAKMLTRLIGEDIEIKTLLTSEGILCMVDGGQIEQVLINLATNARDAMPNGGQLTIKTDCVELDHDFAQAHNEIVKPGVHMLLTVSDTGAGIDPEIMSRIFEPFFTTKDIDKGTGLGLAIIYGIIRQHNGYIEANSELGRGTTFKIYLPAVEGVTEPGDTIKSDNVAIRGNSETILVAEDDEKLRKLFEVVLTHNGYNVVVAKDGDEAIQFFAENEDRIQLVVVDMIMPKKSGKEVYEEIRRIKSDTKVLFISGYTADRFDETSWLLEELNLMTKPISPKDLLKKIADILRH